MKLTINSLHHLFRNAIACKKCSLTFKRKSYLFAHAIKCKGEKSYKSCPVSDECNFRYRLNSTLRAHMKSVHDCDSEPETKCKKCFLTFARLSTLNDHVKMCKGPPSKKLLTCPVSADCNFRARFKHTITVHLKKVHNFDFDPLCEMKFDDWEAFIMWKKKEEKSSGFCFTSQSGMKNGKSFFYCQKDGTDKPHTSMPRKTKRTLRKGRVKTGAFCSAYIRVNINDDDTVSVRYSPTHSHLVENCANTISTESFQSIVEMSRGPADAFCDTNLEIAGEIVVQNEKSENSPPEIFSESLVSESIENRSVVSSIAIEANKVSPNFGFKVHEDEMVTVLCMTLESQELPEGIFEYVNSTVSDGTHDPAVIEIHSADTIHSKLSTIDHKKTNNCNYNGSTIAAVMEIDNSHPIILKEASVPDKTILREKIKSSMQDISTLLENDAVGESVLSSVLQSLQSCRNQIEGEINSTP